MKFESERNWFSVNLCFVFSLAKGFKDSIYATSFSKSQPKYLLGVHEEPESS